MPEVKSFFSYEKRRTSPGRMRVSKSFIVHLSCAYGLTFPDCNVISLFRIVAFDAM